MDIAFITKYLPMYEKAAILTVKIGFIGIAFAILVGLFCAIVQYQKISNCAAAGYGLYRDQP